MIDKAKIVDIIIAEYTALRGEINLYHQHQKLAMNFALLMSIALLSTVITSEVKSFPLNIELLKFIILLFPIFICITGFLYLDKTIRIKRIASYIHNDLRPRLISLTGSYQILNWEIYKQVTSRLRERSYTIALKIDRFRPMIFILPILISLIFYFSKIVPPPSAFEYLLILVDLILSYHLISISLSIEETKGINTDLNDIIETVTSESENNTYTYKEGGEN